MKIAMLTSDYLPGIGGIASHIYSISKALLENGHEVEIWFWDRKGTVASDDEVGDIPVQMIGGGAFSGKKITSKKLARQIAALSADFQPDVIHVHTLDQLMPAMAFIKKQLPSTKIVWTNHTSRFLRNIDSLFWRFKMRYYLRGFDGLLATCPERRVKSLGLGIPDSHCSFIPNGIDPDKYAELSKSQAREIINVDRDRFLLLFTGRFAPIKGVSYLAEAINTVREAIPQILCVMCGNVDGDRESEKVRAYIAENGLEDNIRLEGFVQNKLLGPYLYACDALVLPSLMEATSISMLEAMTVGRPVIGSRVGGIPALVTERETGILVRPKDSADLARGILEFWHLENHGALGTRAKERVKEFSWRNIARKTVEFYDRVGVLPR
jgi:glycosyltransferase involved in cell wall biosynthesis